MTLKSIEIRNYKKFENKKFFFKRGVNVIIGENNSGKSTILETINDFLSKKGKVFSDYYKNYGENEYREKPFIEAVFDNGTDDGAIVQLDTSKNTYKIDFGDIWNEVPAFIGASSGIDYIEKAVNTEFTNLILENQEIQSEIEKIRVRIKRNILDTFKKTDIIYEEQDDYDFYLKTSLEKASSLLFTDKPKSIKNKGLGQQKEFLINFFTEKESIRKTSVVIIDEIENSFSDQSLINIMNKIRGNDIVNQFFISTHRYETISNGNDINVESIGIPPKNLVKGLEEIIWVEGKGDLREFKTIWRNKFFMPSGGNNIKEIARELNDNESFDSKFIVDGDAAGRGYKNDILQINSEFKVHILAKGCLEDYWPEVTKITCYENMGLTTPDPIPNDLLHNNPINSNNRSNYKKSIKLLSDIDINLIKSELNDFINN